MENGPIKEPVEVPDAPSARQIDLIVALIGRLAPLTRPKVYGIEQVPSDGAMLVGNHTIYGVLDVPFMVAELWKQNGVAVRPLGDHRHFAVPVWRDLLEQIGVVRGTPANTAELMRRGEPILVFPGGAREVNKRRGEKYELIWTNRRGFASLAIEHGYPIVPFAAVGGEEMLDIVVDDRNPIYGRLVAATRSMVGVPLPSLVRGIGLTPIPRPQRLYFWFGEPIPTTPYAGQGADGVRHVRDAVKQQVEEGISFLLAERERDPGRHLLKRLVGRGVPPCGSGRSG